VVSLNPKVMLLVLYVAHTLHTWDLFKEETLSLHLHLNVWDLNSFASAFCLEVMLRLGYTIWFSFVLGSFCWLRVLFKHMLIPQSNVVWSGISRGLFWACIPWRGLFWVCPTSVVDYSELATSVVGCSECATSAMDYFRHAYLDVVNFLLLNYFLHSSPLFHVPSMVYTQTPVCI